MICMRRIGSVYCGVLRLWKGKILCRPLKLEIWSESLETSGHQLATFARYCESPFASFGKPVRGNVGLEHIEILIYFDIFCNIL